MRRIEINNDKAIYMGGDRVTSNRSGCTPMMESVMLTQLAKALQLRDSLDKAITDMRSMLATNED